MPATTRFPILFALTAAGVPARDYLPRSNHGAPLESPSKIADGAGQLATKPAEHQHINRYLDVAGPGRYPSIFMVYDSPSGRSLKAWDDTMKALEARTPGLRLMAQLGLWIVPQVQAVAGGGTFNPADVDGLAGAMNATGRPWYVRIGYEFNGSWNGYDAQAYRQVYRQIAQRLREKVTVPLANVWCATPANGDFDSYQPGDDLVDWWGIDLFTAGDIGSGNTAQFLKLADQHRKPVMIGESTPEDAQVNDGQADWDHWFGPYFDLMAKNPGIKAFCYINWDWTNTDWPGWGDCRLETNATVSSLWKAEMGNPIFLHGTLDSKGTTALMAPGTAARPMGARPAAPPTVDALGKRGRAPAQGSRLFIKP